MNLDLADGGDLLDYIMAKGKIRELRSKRLFRDISRAVAYLHERKISHRDLKGENILLKMNPKVLLKFTKDIFYTLL